MSSVEAENVFRSVVKASKPRRMGSVAPRVRFLVHSLDHPEPIDLSPYLLRLQQVDRMTAPFSSWTATLKLPSEQSLLTVLGSVHDDDWAQIDLSLTGERGPWIQLQVGLVDAVRTRMVVTGQGSEQWSLTLSGRGWAKVLTDTMVVSLSKLAGAQYPGAILTVQDLLKLSTEMADQVLGGTPPTTIISDLLSRMLGGIWTVPASLTRNYLVSGASASASVFVDAFWSLMHPAVQTGGGEEVDGTVWRGLSLAGGLRGSLWQLLSSCQSDPALVELWPGWSAEVNGLVTLLRPMLLFRKRPFDDATWSSLPFVSLSMASVAALDLGKSGMERWNLGMVAPVIGGNEMEALLINVSDLPFFEADSVRRHGPRPWFVADSLSPLEGAWVQRAKRQTQFLRDAYLGAPDLLNGTIAVSGVALQPALLGRRLRLTDAQGVRLLDFYVEGLETMFEVGPRGECSLRQTLSVTRGQQAGTA